jgi:hypothetical protein
MLAPPSAAVRAVRVGGGLYWASMGIVVNTGGQHQIRLPQGYFGLILS